MHAEQREMLDIVRHGGFTPPERWVEFGIRNRFKQVPSVRLSACPDCEAPSIDRLGSFVYYSHLVHLIQCARCDLVFTDVRVAPSVIAAHFEVAYKDEEYFQRRRRDIFDHTCAVISSVAPTGASVLDIGGANGHLMASLRTRRSDLAVTVNDLSSTAVEHASKVFGLATIHGGAEEVSRLGQRFDVVVLSDVLYYEAGLKAFLDRLPSLVSDRGSVIIRVPNKLQWIRTGLAMRRTLSMFGVRPEAPQVDFLNPEHLYVFSRRYLRDRLGSLGFGRQRFMPTPLLLGRGGQLWSDCWYGLARLAAMASGDRLIITPGILGVFSR